MDLYTFFSQLISTEDNNLIKEIISYSSVHEYKKGDTIIRTGEKITRVDFLISGVYRGYFIDSSGRDITDCFAYKTGTPLVPSSDLNEPALVTIQTIVSGVVVSVSIQDIKRLLHKYAEVGDLYIRFLTQSANEHWKIKNAVYQYTALQRYQWFQNNYPGLIHKVSNRHIASYLNITPVTLSRIRANLRDHEERVVSSEGAGTIENTDKNKGL